MWHVSSQFPIEMRQFANCYSRLCYCTLLVIVNGDDGNASKSLNDSPLHSHLRDIFMPQVASTPSTGGPVEHINGVTN